MIIPCREKQVIENEKNIQKHLGHQVNQSARHKHKHNQKVNNTNRILFFTRVFVSANTLKTVKLVQQ